MKRSKHLKYKPGSEGMRFVKIDAKTWIEVHESINEDQARKEYLSKIGSKGVEFVPRIDNLPNDIDPVKFKGLTQIISEN